jgi:hypothetical protein
MTVEALYCVSSTKKTSAFKKPINENKNNKSDIKKNNDKKSKKEK